jgi:hypothetical protein
LITDGAWPSPTQRQKSWVPGASVPAKSDNELTTSAATAQHHATDKLGMTGLLETGIREIG